MGYLRTMGPGCAGSTVRYKGVNVNQIQFGNKLQGLPPVTGIRRPHRIYRRRAGGNAPDRYRVFCINQLGGSMVKNSQFASNADGVTECYNRKNSQDNYVGIHDVHHPSSGQSSSHIPRYMDTVQFFSGALLGNTACDPHFYEYEPPTRNGNEVVFSELDADQSCITGKINTRDVDTAICCAGGGSRAYTTCIAALAALERKDIINPASNSRVRLVTSNSGGSWANMVYSYGKHTGVDREEFLGTDGLKNCPMDPTQIKENNVGVISTASARYATRKSESNAEKGWDWIEHGKKGTTFWKDQILEYYMKPYNISDTVMDCSDDANSFDSLFVGTLSGPTSTGPFKVGELSLLEMSPLYTGTKHKKKHTYTGWWKKKELQLGYFTSSRPCKNDASSEFTIGDIVQVSSWAPGIVFSANTILQHFNLKKDLYFKVGLNGSDKVNCTLADGAAVDNLAVIPAVQRGIKNIIIMNNVTPEEGEFEHSSDPKNVNISWELKAYFGQLPNGPPQVLGTDAYDTTHSHIFEKEDFMTLVNNMNTSNNTGNGILCSTTVKTVRNDWYGIPAGQTHNVILLYPNVPVNWFVRLDKDVRKIVNRNKLPYIATSVLNVPPEQSNLMASMITWTINHSNVFDDL